MKKQRFLVTSFALAAPFAVDAAETDPPYSFRDNWPTHHVFADGTDLGMSLKYQFDLNRFSADRGMLDDAQTSRRKEVGIYLKKKNVYDATVVYDFQARTWLDVYLRVQTRALLGHDLGAVRIGYSKLPVGFEGNTGTGSTTFLEAALPMQAVYPGRRAGIDWQQVRPTYLVQAGFYASDLEGDNDGHTTAARFAWTPWKAPGRVLHLGLSTSRQRPRWHLDDRDEHAPPGARLRSRPEAGLTEVRLVDTGNLPFTDHYDRRGLEGLWIGGPWSVQAEYMAATVKFVEGRPAYRGDGFYAFASWVATGESRGYSAGNVGDVKPSGPYGALEFAIRYSELDLDDGRVHGGRQHDWTLGANWYMTRYFKLQANYVRVQSERQGVRIGPDIIEARLQLMF
jgi:phosphate-selective porin OprO/OprP